MQWRTKEGGGANPISPPQHISSPHTLDSLTIIIADNLLSNFATKKKMPTFFFDGLRIFVQYFLLFSLFQRKESQKDFGVLSCFALYSLYVYCTAALKWARFIVISYFFWTLQFQVPETAYKCRRRSRNNIGFYRTFRTLQAIRKYTRDRPLTGKQGQRDYRKTTKTIQILDRVTKFFQKLLTVQSIQYTYSIYILWPKRTIYLSIFLK